MSGIFRDIFDGEGVAVKGFFAAEAATKHEYKVLKSLNIFITIPSKGGRRGWSKFVEKSLLEDKSFKKE